MEIRNLGRKLTALAAAGAGVLGAIGATATAADAVAYESTITQAATIRWCTNLGNPLCANQSVAGAPAGSRLHMVCWQDDSWATGAYRSNRWFYSQFASGKVGFVHSSLVRNQIGTPNCGSIGSMRATNWATSVYGQRRANAVDNTFSNASWAPGPVGEWAGDCPKLAIRAWQYGGVTVPYVGHAIEIYRHYQRRGMIRGGTAPRGAIVFWNRTQWGHMAISLGNGVAIGTQGLDHSNQPIGTYPAGGSGYLGWVMPS